MSEHSSPHPAVPKAPDLRVMTYNIHKGIGGIDRRYRLDRTIEVIRSEDPHIALLQEVDEGVPRSSHDDQSRALAEALGYEFVAHQRNVSVRQGHYGNAILSKFPISRTEDVDLSVRYKKRRQALIAHCDVPAVKGELVVASIHLGLLGVERRVQTRRLMAALEGGVNAIVGGDLNDGSRRLQRIFSARGFHATPRRCHTFPAVVPLRGLDRIFVRGGVHLLRTHVPASHAAKRASDHRPLVAACSLG